MIRKSWLVLLAFALAAFAVGCGDDDKKDDDDMVDMTDMGEVEEDVPVDTPEDTPDTNDMDDTADGTDMDDTSDMDDMTDMDDMADADDMDDMDDMMCMPEPELSWEACSDGIDNDCDMLTDRAEETGCSICPPAADRTTAEDTDELCGDGIDNDCDGFADCVDFDCRNAMAVTVCVENTDALCSDGIDNNGDGRIDCLGRDCSDDENVTVCQPMNPVGAEDDMALCSDLLDNDADGRTDCDDDECEGIGYCAGPGDNESDVSCTDGNDNDGDGQIDCLDEDCSEDAACVGENTDMACSDGMDNDNDGAVDCADADCYANPAISACSNTVEICDNSGVDDDEDGLADCFDPECTATCESLPCGADNPVGTCTETDEICNDGGICARELGSFTIGTDATFLITEIMPDTDSTESDHEYFEVQNISATETISLLGLEVSDDSATEVVTERRALAPGEQVVFARNADPAANGGINDAIDFDLGFGLRNSGEDLTLSHMGTDIHTVTWPGTGNDLENTGAGAVEGGSFNLDVAYLADPTNVTPTWCITPPDAMYEYDMGNTANYGTPGSDNFDCSTLIMPNLFFSEYVEDGGDKAVEIYNGSGGQIDLATCSVLVYSNGATTPNSTIGLTGTLADGAVHVLCNPSTSDTSNCDETSGGLSFNGDDAVELSCGGTTQDVIGQIGTDPGSAWTGGGLSTESSSLLRLCSVTAGDNDGSDAFDPSAEFEAGPTGANLLDDLGAWTCP